MLMGLSEEDYKTVLTMIQSKKMTSVLFSKILFVISVSNTLSLPLPVVSVFC